MEHAQIVQSQLFVARGDAAELLQAPHAALNQVALAVRFAVELFRPRLVLAVRDHRHDASFPQELAYPAGGIPLVPGKFGGPLGRAAGTTQLWKVLHQGDDMLGFVLLAGADLGAGGRRDSEQGGGDRRRADEAARRSADQAPRGRVLMMDPAPEHISFDTVLQLNNGEYKVEGGPDAG